MPTAQHTRSTRLMELPERKTVDEVMLQIAGSYRRVHKMPEWHGKYWVESRYTHRGWFAILWPWPEVNHMRGCCRQRDAGQTLPLYATRDEAVEWAWTLAAMKDDEGAIKPRIYPWRGL